MVAHIKVMMSEDVVVDRGFYRVKLSHAAGAIGYRDPMPMLADHEYWRVIGQVVDSKHDAHQNFGNIVLDEAMENPENKDVVRQMQPNEAGYVFRKNVSVGIKPDFSTLAVTEQNNPKGPLITVNNWIQTELSSVGQPAIPNAGTYKIEGEEKLSKYAMASWHFEDDGKSMDDAVKELLASFTTEGAAGGEGAGNGGAGGLGTIIASEETETEETVEAETTSETEEASEEETTEETAEETEEASEEETTEETPDETVETESGTKTGAESFREGEANMPENVDLLQLGAKLDSALPGAAAMAVEFATKNLPINDFIAKLATINENKHGRIASDDMGKFDIGTFVRAIGTGRFDDNQHEMVRSTEAKGGMEDLLRDNEHIIPFEAFDIPNLLQQFTVGVGSTGSANFIPTITDQQGFIPSLVDRARFMAFCDVKTGLIGDYEAPKFSALPATAEIADGAVAVLTDPTLTGITMKPVILQAATDLGQLILHQTSQRIATDLQMNMLDYFADRIAHAMIHGTTTIDGILELAVTTGNANKVVAADLAAVTYSKMVELETEIVEAKAPERNRLYLVSPKIAAKGKTTAKDTSSLPTPWITGGRLDDYPALTTTHLADSIAIFAAMQEMIIGIWGRGVGVRRTVTDDGNDRMFFRMWWNTAYKHNSSFSFLATS